MYTFKTLEHFVRHHTAYLLSPYNKTTQKLFCHFSKQLEATGIEDKKVAFEYICQGADLN